MNVMPVLLRELRSQMRGRRAMVALTAYLLILVLMAMSMYAITAHDADVSDVESQEGVGQGLFAGLAILQAGLVILLAPAFTANAISQEREQKTFDLLVITKVEPAAIVVGKLAASLAYLAMVLVASLPVMALPFVFGGVEPAAIAAVFGCQLLFALTFGSVGLFFSSFVRRTLWSTVFAYVAIFVIVAVGPVLDAALNVVVSQDRFQPLFTYLNPFPLLMAVVSSDFSTAGSQEAIWFSVVTPLAYLTLSTALLVAASFLVAPGRRPGRLGRAGG